MKIDIELLKKQKESLLVVISILDNGSELQEHLDGILNMLDAIQDEQEDGKKGYYFLLGQTISKLYAEGDFSEVLFEAKEDPSIFDLTKYIEGENPEYLLNDSDGWMGYATITKEEYEQLLAIKEQES